MGESEEFNPGLGSDGQTISLSNHLRHNAIAIGEAVAIARKIADTLVSLHGRGQVVKGLNPSSVFIHRQTKKTFLPIPGYFIMNGTLKAEDEAWEMKPHGAEKATLLREYLPYIAPEQTGRIDHAPDHRMDIYALGTLLFEMLTGRPPFTEKTTLKTLHAHMAIPAPNPRTLNPGTPEILADITLTLLEKSPDDRYQSARGVLTDLTTCQEQLETTGEIRPFPLGIHDLGEVFRPSTLIYGREKEQKALSAAWDAASQGNSPRLWISGDPGMGKTTLVKAFSKEIQDKGGLFLSTKFEQTLDETPYRFLPRLFEGIVQRILSSGEDELLAWRTTLSDHIGTNGQILTEIIPEFELVLGSKKPVPLPPDETRNRLVTVLKGLFTALSEDAPPLVLFFDDLQWAPAEALALLTDLFENEPMPATLRIGAFRNHTKESSPHLVPWLKTLDAQSKTTPHLSLSGLGFRQIQQLISDTFRLPLPETGQMARRILEKSRGNPFFIHEFLISLYEKGLIFFLDTWVFDLQKIGRLSFNDDILEILGQRISKLSYWHRRILEFASCIGADFKSGFIARLTGDSEELTRGALEEFTARDLLVRIGSTYRFSHDKVNEAVSSRLSEEKKAAHHHLIGTLLLKSHGGVPKGNALFETTNHLNRGVTQIKGIAERITLAQLNLDAAMAARTSAAFETALRYAETGLELLPEVPWENHEGLALALTVEAGEAAHQTGERDRADALLETALTHASSDVIKARIYTITTRSRIRSGDVTEAYAMALSSLKAMGEKLPHRMGRVATLKEFIKAAVSLRGREIPNLVNLPELTDPKQMAVARLYKLTFEACYIAQPDALPFISLKFLNHTLKHGISSHSAFAASFYGMILCSSGLSIDKGFQFGELGLALLNKYPDTHEESEVHLLFGGMICHWKRPYREARPYLDHALRCAREIGNFPTAAYSINHILILQQYLGTSLIDYLPENEGFTSRMDRFQQNRSRQGFAFGSQYILNLTSQKPEFKDFKGPLFDETEIEKKRVEKDQTAIGNYASFKGILCYLSGDHDEAAEIMAEAIPALPGIAGTLFIPDFHLFYGLNLAAIHPKKGRIEKWRSRRVMAHSLKKLQRWAAHAPENFKCRALLLQAEISRIQDKPFDAMSLYDEAMASARENDFSQIEAVACECAFRFHLTAKREAVARLYLTQAREAFTAWGALAKVAQLDATWPQFLASPPSQVHRRKATREPDLISIIEASQAIAGETDLSRLMERLMAIVIENAGARIGSLILTGEDDRLTVEARVGQDQAEPHPAFNALDTAAQGVIHYVIRTGTTVLLPPPTEEPQETHFHPGKGPRSTLCMPLVESGKTLGALYLENDLLERAFTLNRVEVLKTVTDILAHARARQKAEEEVILYQEKLRGLSSQLLLTEEKERRRIAVGLHDDIGQALTLTRLKLSTLKNTISKSEVEEELDQINQLVDQTIYDIRNLTFELSPPDLYELGLAAALDTLAEEMLEPHGIKIDFEESLGEDPLPESSRILLYQATKEAMFNIVKHAQATRVNLSMESKEGIIQVSITDNGVGFDIPETFDRRHKTKAFGLFSIKERLAHHGGHITLTPGPASGTRVVLSLPI